MDGWSSWKWLGWTVECSMHWWSHSFTFLTVGFTLLHVEGLVPDGILAGRTLETLNMVGHLQGVHDFLRKGEKKQTGNFSYVKLICCCLRSEYIHWNMWKHFQLISFSVSGWSPVQWSSHPGDLLFALGTVWSISVIVALGAVHGPPLLKETPLIQNHFTLRTGELLRVPGTSQRHQVPAPVNHTPTL